MIADAILNHSIESLADDGCQVYPSIVFWVVRVRDV